MRQDEIERFLKVCKVWSNLIPTVVFLNFLYINIGWSCCSCCWYCPSFTSGLLLYCNMTKANNIVFYFVCIGMSLLTILQMIFFIVVAVVCVNCSNWWHLFYPTISNDFNWMRTMWAFFIFVDEDRLLKTYSLWLTVCPFFNWLGTINFDNDA